MNPVLEEIIKTGNTRSVNGDLVKVIGQVSEEEGNLIRKAITGLNAEVSIEIGLAFGVSALFICEALTKTQRTKHYVIDPYQLYDQSYGGIGLNNLKKAGYENIIHFINKPSHQALASTELENVKADFAFIDGWHTFDHTLIDFFLVDKILRIGGIVIIDDTDWPAIQKACSFILNNRSYSICGTTSQKSYIKKSVNNLNRNSSGLKRLKSYFTNSDAQEKLSFGSIAFRKESDDTRKWDHFVDF